VDATHLAEFHQIRQSLQQNEQELEKELQKHLRSLSQAEQEEQERHERFQNDSPSTPSSTSSPRSASKQRDTPSTPQSNPAATTYHPIPRTANPTTAQPAPILTTSACHSSTTALIHEVAEIY
jgi:hypothetical protein